MTNPQAAPRKDVVGRDRAQRLAWVVGVLGVIGAIVGWITEPISFPHAWLAALTAWLGWPLGCLGLLLTHALTGGRWGYALRPQLVAGTSTIWLWVPAAIPWLLALSSLYPWARAGASAGLASAFYLNRPFFYGRVIFYAVVWIGLSALVSRALRRRDPDAALARIAPAGLILLAITITFSSIDLTMSLDPRFDSSVYGLIALSEMGLFALAVAVFAATLGAPPDSDTLGALGKLLLGLALLWAYLDFMQFLIVWQSNLSPEAPWYLVRTSGIWGMSAMLISSGHFALPFCLLIWPRVRRSRVGIAVVTALLGLSAIGRAWWTVVPASHAGFAFVDAAAMVCLIGIGAAFSLRGPPGPPDFATSMSTGAQHG